MEPQSGGDRISFPVVTPGRMKCPDCSQEYEYDQGDLREFENKYRVILHEHSTPNDLGEMTEIELLGFLGTRLGSLDAADSVLREAGEKGKAITHFETPLAGKTLIEIHRI